MSGNTTVQQKGDGALPQTAQYRVDFCFTTLTTHTYRYNKKKAEPVYRKAAPYPYRDRVGIYIECIAAARATRKQPTCPNTLGCVQVRPSGDTGSRGKPHDSRIIRRVGEYLTPVQFPKIAV